MKKIAFVLYYYHPYKSGLSEYAKSIAEELASNGYEVDIITTKFDTSLKEKEFINGVNIYRKNVLLSISKGVLSPGIFTHLFAKRKEYDMFFIFLPFTESFVFPLLIPKEKLYTFYVCDINIGSRLVENLLFASMKFLLHRSEKIIVLSRDYYDHCKIMHKNLSDRVFPLFPYYRYDEAPKYAVDYRSKYNISKDAFVIGFLGRIVYEKGIDYLLDAFKIVKSKIKKECVLLIGGDYQNVRGGSVIDKLKDKITEFGNSVKVTGFIPEEEKNDFFRSQDVFVLPSIDPLEAFGIVQLEAMKNNVPVVASELPGVREIVQKTNYGKIAKIKSSKSIADKIIEIYNQKSKVALNQEQYKKYYSKEVWLKYLNSIIK